MLNTRSLPPHGDGQLVECERSRCSDPAFLFRLRLGEVKGWAWGTAISVICFPREVLRGGRGEGGGGVGMLEEEDGDIFTHVDGSCV